MKLNKGFLLTFTCLIAIADANASNGFTQIVAEPGVRQVSTEVFAQLQLGNGRLVRAGIAPAVKLFPTATVQERFFRMMGGSLSPLINQINAFYADQVAAAAEADAADDAADAADDVTPNGTRFNAFMLRGMFYLEIANTSRTVYDAQTALGNPDPAGAARDPEFLLNEFAVNNPGIVALLDIRDYVIGRIQQLVDRDFN